MVGAVREKLRDAERSRRAILAAAEALFAERGFEGASLNDIGAAAGLSRGSPSYFFGSKEDLYNEVLASVFAARQEATRQAFVDVVAWCEGEEGLDGLRRALTSAARGYMHHLLAHPAFVALIMREELEDGRRLRGASRSSTAMTDAFRAVRRAGPRRGVRSFRVEEAVLLFVALTFTPISYRRTLLPAQGVEVAADGAIRRLAKLAGDQMTCFLSG